MITAVIVQARFRSTRLPGKVLRRIGSQSVLAHVLERCAAIPGADVICCAAPEGKADDAIAEEATRCGVRVFRGSEDDVLDRYARAAVSLNAAVVLRVTSDCPMIDPALCGEVLALRARRNADYACNNLPPSWPLGLDCEALTAEWLARAAREAKRPSEREHVTPFVRNHPDSRKVNLAGPGGALVEQRWTLDTEPDFTFLTAVFARLPAGRAGWNWRAALAAVTADPALARLNAGQDRYAGLKKSLAEDSARGFDVAS